MKTIAVIPAYNEEKIVAQVVQAVKKQVDQIVVVDDGSVDTTANLATQAGAQVLRHFLNRGQGAALQTGIIFALKCQADIIVTFDADGQHHATDIEEVIKPILLGEAEVVLGSRFLTQNRMPLARKVILKIATFFTRVYTGLPVTDTHNGFRAFSARAAELINITQDGMAHASEIIEQIGKHQLKFKEVPVKVDYTVYSRQKGQHLSDSFKIILDLIFGRISK